MPERSSRTPFIPPEPKTPTSYDEILRATVPEPQLSFRPSLEEELRGRHRFGEPTEHRPRPLREPERELLARVHLVLAADPALDLSCVEVDVDGTEVVLIGFVPGPATKIRIADLAASVRGVEAVDNQLAVRPRTT